MQYQYKIIRDNLDGTLKKSEEADARVMFIIMMAAIIGWFGLCACVGYWWYLMS